MVRTGDTARPASELIGYARVSTDAQNLALQLDALHQAGCARVYSQPGGSVWSTAMTGRPDRSMGQRRWVRACRELADNGS